MVFASEVLQRARSLVFRRKTAYEAVFRLDSPAVDIVLVDLAQFCRANESCFHADPRIHAVLEGRREVFTRIQQMIKLSQEDTWKLFGRKDIE